MNSFRRKKIQCKTNKTHKDIHTSLFRRILRYIPKNKTEYNTKKVPFFLLIITILITGGIIFKVTYTAYEYLTNFELQDLLMLLSTDLSEDEYQRTNILILGNGGGDHDGADLIDTIIIASLNHIEKSANLLSIPRDLWLDLPGYQSSRINKIYENLKPIYGADQALDILRENIENITNLDIPYYIKIDFAGFEKVIDTLGGVDIEVERNIYDTKYPKEDESGYETFSLDAGLHHLDGETALKYARSRHSTSDFDRATRQHRIINAIKTKAAERSIFRSPLLLKKLYEDFSENIETNLKLTELISLANLAKSFEEKKITSAVLKDDDIIDKGTFLYTPDRELYGGAFVLIPTGGTYKKIQDFITIIFNYPNFFTEAASIQILNGTGEPGLAGKLGNKLIPFGFTIRNYDNADNKKYKTSHFYIHNPKNTRVTEKVIKLLFPLMIKRKTPPPGINTSYDISIILGSDFDIETF